MKKLIVIIALFASKALFGQAPDYNDLRILFADGKYEKLVGSAEKYTNSDKTKTDPVPYMWMARGLYKVSLSGTDNEKFKNAYKDAIGVLGKSIKYDKSGDCQREFAEFYDEFKNSMVELIRISLEVGKFKDAAPWITKYYKINLKSPGAKYLDGVCKFRNADKSGANALWKEADGLMKDVTDISEWSQAEKDLLMLGAMYVADCYVSIKQVDKAKAILGKVAQWFEGNEDFKAKYDEIVN